MLEPLANPFIAVSKKYLSTLSKMVAQISIDRYHYVLILLDSHDENLTQKALSEILNIDKSYMATILDYLATECQEPNHTLTSKYLQL